MQIIGISVFVVALGALLYGTTRGEIESSQRNTGYAIFGIVLIVGIASILGSTW